MKNVKREETPTDLDLRKMQLSHGDQMGKKRKISLLFQLSRMQKHHEFHS